MSLESKLQSIRDGAAKRIPDQTRAVMADATRALRESGILERVIQVVDTLPPFELANRNGDVVRSAELLARGPLVLSVFRGSW
jgi:hypothetical protein